MLCGQRLRYYVSNTGIILATRGSQLRDVEIDANGLKLHTDIVQRHNENRDAKGGKWANKSADAGHKRARRNKLEREDERNQNAENLGTSA